MGIFADHEEDICLLQELRAEFCREDSGLEAEEKRIMGFILGLGVERIRSRVEAKRTAHAEELEQHVAGSGGHPDDQPF